jgi:hypothetical protein
VRVWKLGSFRDWSLSMVASVVLVSGRARCCDYQEVGNK